MLAAMAVLLVAAFLLGGRYPWLGWVQSFAEAGLVGGLADWFAVVALFRRPIGLPIPHTGIVPRNKDRIGAELGEFVERNFLTPENIVGRLHGVDFAFHAARFVSLPANAAQIADALRSVVPRLLDALDDAEIEQALGQIVATRLAQLDLAALSGRILTILTESGRHQALLDQILTATGRWIDANRGALGTRFGAQSRWTPKWIDAYVVDRFVDAVIALVDEIVAAPRHELRDSFDRYVQGFIESLQTEPALRDKIERLKLEILRHLAPERFVGVAWAEIKTRVAGAAGPRLAAVIVNLGRAVRNDRRLMDRVNAGILVAIEAGLGRFRRQFAALIADVVRRWDADEVARNIELEVGSDLQYIRLNGTLVGGAAGLAIHAVLAWLGAVLPGW